MIVQIISEAVTSNFPVYFNKVRNSASFFLFHFKGIIISVSNILSSFVLCSFLSIYLLIIIRLRGIYLIRRKMSGVIQEKRGRGVIMNSFKVGSRDFPETYKENFFTLTRDS